jgi:hypothetical protein
MFSAKFLNFRSFEIFWGLTAALLVFIWVRYLVEPRRTAASWGLTRLKGLRVLLMLSVGWYVVWMGARAARYMFAHR